MTEAVPLSAPPREDQLVEHDGKTYRTIREGLAYILVPPNIKTQQDPRAKSAKADESNIQAQKVFYNPIQQFSRDLSVLAIKAFGEDLLERRLPQLEKNRERFAAKKEKKRQKKRRHEDDDQAGDPVKIQRLNGDDAAEHETSESTSVEQQVNGDVSDNAVAFGAAAEESEEGTQLEDETTTTIGQSQIADTHNEAESAATLTKPLQVSFRILDALSATGLRALRYAQEIPMATNITANDMDSKAVDSIRLHLEHNKLADKITPINSNAIGHMYSIAHPPSHTHGPAHINNKYDVIDLDPYGTAGPFIDAALQALNDGGLLCVTCTDSGVFASVGYSEKTFSLYGGLPVRGNHNHEVGLRLILHSIATAGARYGIAIEPLLSLSIDFYARLFIRVRRSPADVKFLASKTMVSYECDSGCGAWTTQMFGRSSEQESAGNNTFWKYSIAQAPTADRLCQHCGSKTHIAGPMWSGVLHNPAFLEKLLKTVETVDKTTYQTSARIEGMVDTALDELSVDKDWSNEKTPTSIPRMRPELTDRTPFFFQPSAVSKAFHCQAPPEAAVRGALRHAGYLATRSHCKPGSIKTNAPWSAVFDIFREWVAKKRPIKVENVKKGSPAWTLLRLWEQENGVKDLSDTDAKTDHPAPNAHEKGPMKVVFDEVLGKDANPKRLVRYQINPRENWGPMARAK